MTKQLPTTEAWSFIGMAVHVMDAEKGRTVQFQGHVVHQYQDRILVQWFDWVMGQANYATWHTLNEASVAKWRFFQTMEDANSYLEANRFRLLPKGDE